jgi:hypothetical protein
MLLAICCGLGVFASGFATTNQVVSAAPAGGFGSVIDNFVSGPTAQSAASSWQYFEIPDSLSTATLLSNWQTTGNEIISNQNQWDNDRVNGNYPFVQLVQTPPVATFGGNAGVLIHPDNSSYRAAIGWKNTTGATVVIDYAATLKFAYPGNNSDGVTYSFQRGLSGTARYQALKSGTISTGSTATTQLDGSLVELQNGELVYLTVGNNGNYYWDHTIATLSISLSAPPVSTVVGTDTIVTFSTVGSRTWSVPASVTTARILLIAGGGGGGNDNGGGGGGGGFVSDSSVSLSPGTLMTVVVGNGGAGSANVAATGSNGGNSSFAGLIALGGGGGGSIQSTAGADGGSAGGRAANYFGNAEAAIPTTSPLQGNNGGGKSLNGYAGAGGGGAGAAGSNGGGSSSVGGNGGAGRASNISGINVTYAGGGGGGGNCSVAGSGGSGGGANGSSQGDQAPGQGVDGLGGGGGGGGGCTVAGAGSRGGSGIVVIRYVTPAAPTNTSTPVISGTTRTGSTLSIASDAWTGSPTSFTYQWKRSATSGGSYTNIGSATNSTYVLTDDDINKYIKVSVIATNGIGSSTAELSAATSQISDVLPAPTTTAVPVATTAAPALSIVIQAPVTTVAQGQASVATIAPISTVARSGASVTTTTVAARASSVTTTTVARPVTTTTVGPPNIAKVSAGESSVLVDGVKTNTKVARENNAMIVTAGAVSATLSGINDQGKTVPLDSDGSVRLSAGDSIKVAVGGFKPDSEVEVWLFSTPLRLGSASVGSDGSMSKTFILPAGVKSGNHRVAVLAKLPNGKTATFTLGIVVGEFSTTSTLTRVLIAIPIALAIGFGLILPNRLRRRRTTATSGA